jgi:hypothetical protein
MGKYQKNGFSLHDGIIVLSLRLLRDLHLSLQYFTSSQTFSHFFLQEKDRPQLTQTF